MNDLPNGWRRVALAGLGEWYGGGTPSKSQPEFWTGGSVPWLSPKDMGAEVLQSTQDLITEAAIVGSAVRRIPAGSVALVVRSGILERTLPIAVVPFAVTLNQDMKAVVPRPDIDARWIAWGLRNQERELLRRCRKGGTTVASIETSRLLEQELPVPPLREQRRIVEVLEDHLSRLEAADSGLRDAERRLSGLRAGLLATGLRGGLVEDDLREGSGHDLLNRCDGDDVVFAATKHDKVWAIPESWAWVRIGDVFPVFIGATPSRADASLWGTELPWLSSGEVAFNRISTTKESIRRSAAGNPDTRIHPPGTVMLAMIGEGKTRGQVAILDIEAAHNQNCASIRVAGTGVLPEYLFAFFQERYLETRRAASGGNQPALNKAVVRNIAIPIPPLGTQRRLVERFVAASESEARLRRDLDHARRRATGLRQALLSAAFAGRLSGPTNDDSLEKALASV